MNISQEDERKLFIGMTIEALANPAVALDSLHEQLRGQRPSDESYEIVRFINQGWWESCDNFDYMLYYIFSLSQRDGSESQISRIQATIIARLALQHDCSDPTRKGLEIILKWGIEGRPIPQPRDYPEYDRNRSKMRNESWRAYNARLLLDNLRKVILGKYGANVGTRWWECKLLLHNISCGIRNTSRKGYDEWVRVSKIETNKWCDTMRKWYPVAPYLCQSTEMGGLRLVLFALTQLFKFVLVLK